MNFIEEFKHLLVSKPRYNLKQVMAENCDFSDTAVKSKNCYYCFGVFYCEDVYYARYSRKCSNCSGLTLCANCEWCIECIDCVKCYGCDYCQDCQNCSESQYCKDCFGCKNCFGCVGLYQKQYCLFNEQHSEKEYKEKISKLNLQNEGHRAFVRQELEKLRITSANLGIQQFQTEDCIGNHISESRGCYQCYDIFASEDCLYNIEANGNKDSCDITVCFETEGCYNCVQSPLCYRCNYLFHVDSSSESEFCAYSRNLKNCFGCVYMENKQYYILNKPYSSEKYFKEVEAIKKELITNNNYNLGIYFVSEYEKKKEINETEPVIQQVPN